MSDRTKEFFSLVEYDRKRDKFELNSVNRMEN